MKKEIIASFKSFTLNDVFAGVLSGFIIVVIATVFTALIFTGPLSAYFSLGITCALIGSCLVNALTAVFSSFRFAIGRPEPAIGVILAIMCGNIAKTVISSDFFLSTIIAMFILTTLSVGVIMVIMGYFRLGQSARFLPYPVLCGIIASMGWFMAFASFALMEHKSFHANWFSNLDIVLQYIIWLGFGLYLIAIAKHNTSRPWIMPVSILMAAFVINIILRLNHISHLDAIQRGWLFKSFKPEFVWNSINVSMLHQIDWSAIHGQLGYLATLIGIIIIILLFNVSSLEATFKSKADLEEELKVCGFGNILNSLFVGVPCNLSFSGTLLNNNAGAVNRFSGMIASIVCLGILFIYPELISYLPKPIVAGLLLYTAMTLLYEWLFRRWNKLPYIDYFVVVAILVAAAIWGFLQGVIIGLVIACISFIVRYARINVIKLAITGENYHSNVIRPLYQQNWLRQQGAAIQIFKLQGYIFFGSTKLLLDEATGLIENSKNKIKYLIFDFQSVNGIDSSASYGFVQLKQLIEDRQLQLIFTHCSEHLLYRFRQQQVLTESSKIILFPDLDQGVEWCEEELLRASAMQITRDGNAIANTLSELIPNKNELAIFKTILEKVTTPAQFILFKQGAESDALYFIESGDVAVFLESKNFNIRLSKSGPGTIIGEIGFYLHTPRTATVVTESPCVMYKLTEEALKKLEQIHPEIALSFNKSVVHTLAARVMQTNYELNLLMQ